MPVPIRGFPFGTVTGQPAAAPAGGVADAPDLATFQLAYQMIRDAKALPTNKVSCLAGNVVPLAQNTRNTPVFIRIRAALNSVAPPWLYIGADASQTQHAAVTDRISDGGQIEFLLYPGQELWMSYVGDVGTIGDAFVSIATFDEAVMQVRRATGQV